MVFLWYPIKFGRVDRANRVLIIIPAYNEEQAINQVIDQLASVMPLADILVVNDASTDATASILDLRKDIQAIHLPMNLGIGGCVQTGFRYAVDHFTI